MIRAYWLRILLFGVVGGIIALLISRVMPKKYQADVTLKVDQSVPATSLVDTNQGDTVLDYLQWSRPRNIVTQVDQLQSLGTLTTAAKAVASANNLPDPTTDPQSELNPINLQNEINITADQNSDIINLEVRLSSAKIAEDAANEIYLAFTGENADSTKEMAQRAILSLRSQSDKIDKQLSDIDQKVSDLRAQSGMTDPTTQITAEITGLTTLKQQRDQAAVDQAAARRSVDVLTQELAKTPQKIKGTATTGPNPLYEKLQEDLLTAQSDRASLLQMYDPSNEQVKALDDRIKNVQSQLKRIKPTIEAAANEDINQNYQVLQQQLSTAKALADSADQKYAVAAKQVTDKEDFLKTLPPIQTKLAALDRQKLALEKIYFGYEDQLKTLEASKEGRSSPTQMITQATAIPEPVSPKIWINAIFGVLVGLLLGVASVQVLEAKRQPIRSLVQLNGLAQEPVYRMIPELREPFRGKTKAPPESYEGLLVHYLGSGARPYRMAVVGLNRDSGASTAALNLSIAASRHGSRVLYVQCDPKGALARIGHANPNFGEVFEAMPSVDAVATGTILNVSSSQGGIDSHVTSRERDLTIIDLEPVSHSAEFAFLAPHVDEVVLLVQAGKARGVDFLQAQQALHDSGCKRVTVVFTRSSDFAVTVDAVDSEGPQPTAWPATRPSAPVNPPTAFKALEAEAEPRVEPAPVAAQTAFRPEPQSAAEIAEATSEEAVEEPIRRARTKPAVTVEDFGSITRVKPQVPLGASKANVPQTKPRRGSIDTSEIDS